MTQDTLRVRTPTFVQLHQDDHAAVRAVLAAGLQACAAFISPNICTTRWVHTYLKPSPSSPSTTRPVPKPRFLPATHRRWRRESGRFDAGGSGGGNCEKAARLFDVLRPVRYVAVDISVAFLPTPWRPCNASIPGWTWWGWA